MSSFKIKETRKDAVLEIGGQEDRGFAATAISRQSNISHDAVTDELHTFFSTLGRKDITEFDVFYRARTKGDEKEGSRHLYGYLNITPDQMTRIETTSYVKRIDELESIFDDLTREIKIPMEDFDRSQEQLHEEELNQLNENN